MCLLHELYEMYVYLKNEGDISVTTHDDNERKQWRSDDERWE